MLVNDVPSSRELHLGTRNSKWISLTTKELLNVYDLLKHDKIVITKESIEMLKKRTDPHAKISPPPEKDKEKSENQDSEQVMES